MREKGPESFPRASLLATLWPSLPGPQHILGHPTDTSKRLGLKGPSAKPFAHCGPLPCSADL